MTTFAEYGKDQYGCTWKLILRDEDPQHWVNESVLVSTYILGGMDFDKGARSSWEKFAAAGGDVGATFEWTNSYAWPKDAYFYEAIPYVGVKYRTQNKFYMILGVREVDTTYADVGFRDFSIYQYVCPCEGIIGAPSPAIGLLPILGIGLLGLGAVWAISKAMKKRK